MQVKSDKKSTPISVQDIVVAQVECGPEPRINLTVKNYPSSIDPVYTTKQSLSYSRDCFVVKSTPRNDDLK